MKLGQVTGLKFRGEVPACHPPKIRPSEQSANGSLLGRVPALSACGYKQSVRLDQGGLHRN